MRFQKILLPTDFSACASAALAHAIFLTDHFDARLDLLHVVAIHTHDPFNPAAHFPDANDIFHKLQEMTASEMRQLTGDRQTDHLDIREVQRRGISAAPEIVAYAEEEGCDLIVMGAHGRRGLRRFLLGSVAEEVVRLAPCPVLTMRGEESQPLSKVRKIVAPIDFSEPAKEALLAAKDLAATFGSRVDVVHVVEPSLDPQLYLPFHDRFASYSAEELVAAVRDGLGPMVAGLGGPEVEGEVEVLEGHAAARITEYAEAVDADLIVIATHGLTGVLRFLLGSVTEKVVRGASCPVLTLRGSAQAQAAA
ncbi:MAG: universal stress protein [bacterium]|nr:universal stress protein [bacterium]